MSTEPLKGLMDGHQTEKVIIRFNRAATAQDNLGLGDLEKVLVITFKQKGFFAYQGRQIDAFDRRIYRQR